MACADADGTFISIDVGYPGRNNDAGVFHSSTLGKWVKQNSLDFPLPRALPNNVSNEPVPFFFCGDEAFPLLENLMRPYPRRFLNDTKRVFNYRLSRGRKSVECAFGMMSMKFRVLEKPIQCKPGNLKKLFKLYVCCTTLSKQETEQQAFLNNLSTLGHASHVSMTSAAQESGTT